MAKFINTKTKIIHPKRGMMSLTLHNSGRRDSNSHEGCSLEPKSSASTNFATSAFSYI